MPSIITHDTFGREIYSGLEDVIGQSADEREAFLLGCQGPDVLFYGLINPFIKVANWYGSALHRYYCSEFVSSLVLSVLSELTLQNEENFEIVKSYALGYLMHHELDSKVHPFVYAQQYALCSVGIPGLDKRSESEVHVEIERELDELVLSTKRQETIASFDPSERILLGSDEILNIISKMYEFAIRIVYQRSSPAHMYRSSVKASRQVQRIIYSTGGVKRNIFGSVETLFRDHSYIRAITHKNKFITESIFDNHEKYTWQNPWIENENCDLSFWDLYNNALTSGKEHILRLAEIIEKVSPQAMSRDEKIDIFRNVADILGGVNFYGCPEKIAQKDSGKPKIIFK